ncbi:MAG: hypothetical protein QOH61_2033, partial [Chloroflexota bacterium]|nr:hypothetical protein [Chloroflexota bacterium]
MMSLVLGGEPERAVGMASAALQAELTPDAASAAQLARLVGLVAIDDLAAAREVIGSMLAGGDDLSGDAVLATALTAMAFSVWDAARAADGLSLLRAATRRADRAPRGGAQPYPRLHLAAALTALGYHDEAAETIDECAAEIARSGDVLWSAGPHVRRAVLDVARGRPGDAVVSANGALELCDQLGTRFFTPAAAAVLVEVALLRGDVSEAVRQMGVVRAALPSNRAAVSPCSLIWLEARLAQGMGASTSAAVHAL